MAQIERLAEREQVSALRCALEAAEPLSSSQSGWDTKGADDDSHEDRQEGAEEEESTAALNRTIFFLASAHIPLHATRAFPKEASRSRIR